METEELTYRVNDILYTLNSVENKLKPVFIYDYKKRVEYVVDDIDINIDDRIDVNIKEYIEADVIDTYTVQDIIKALKDVENKLKPVFVYDLDGYGELFNIDSFDLNICNRVNININKKK